MNARTRTTPRDPLCEEALRTNRELRERVSELETRLATPKGEGRLALRSKLTACERELRERDESPWVFLPWRGYVS